ncbi:MAG: efflux RND transporter permease subunit [Bacteroidota bacterium]
MIIPKLAIENYRFTLLVLSMFVLGGVFSVLTMPRSEDPAFTSPGALITVIYPGASAEKVEKEVLQPLEDAIRKIDDIEEVSGSAYENAANIGLRYQYGIDFDQKLQEVTQELSAVKQTLPESIIEFEINAFSAEDVNIYQFAFTADSTSFDEIETFAELLKERIELVPGIRTVNTSGIPEKEVKIDLNMEKMAQMKLPLNQVIGSVVQANESLPSGNVNFGTRDFNVSVNSTFSSLLDIENTIVHSINGRIIYLKDIAEVEFGVKEEYFRHRFNGKPAVFVVAEQKASTNIFDIDKSVKAINEDIQEMLPDGIELSLAFDQTDSVRLRVNDFFLNLLQGMLLVGVVILLMVGFRPSVLILLAIPVSIIIGLGFVDLAGFGIQQISIAGLIVALGLLVDNAIVVVENVDRYIELGENPVMAAIKGATQVGWPITTATLTTIFAFAPLLSVQDASGDFLKSMPVTVIFTVAASLLVALAFTPFLASKFFKTGENRKKTVLQKALSSFIDKNYAGMLKKVLEFPKTTILFAIILFVGSVYLIPIIGLSFFPKAEKPTFLINVNTPSGTDLERTDAIVLQIEEQLQQEDLISGYASSAGRQNPKIYYNMFPVTRAENLGQILVNLKDYDPDSYSEIVRRLRSEFKNVPGARVEVKEFEQGAPLAAPVAFRIIGKDMEVLKRLGDEVKNKMEIVDGIYNTHNPLEASRTDLKVVVNKERAAAMGVTMDEVNRVLRTAISGLSITDYSDPDGNSYDVTVSIAKGGNFKMNDFNSVYVQSLGGAILPLSQIASFEFESKPQFIHHYNLERSITVTADVEEGYNVNGVTAEVEELVRAMEFPPGYRFTVSGEVESMFRALRGIGRAAIFAIISIFAVLVLQFRSFIQPFVIFSAMPFAAIGSLLALYVTGSTISFTAFIGLTSLIGIVVNDSIILVDFANQARREGVKDTVAIVEAGKVRFIPIVLTSLTTIGGLLPLTLRGGTLWAPMGWTIIGGLMTSTFLILFVVPALYRLMAKSDD